MVVDPRIDAMTWLRDQLAEECPDLARAMLERMASELMGAAADAICEAPYGERSRAGQPAQRDQIRRRDAHPGTIELEIPKLGQGSDVPDRLLARPPAGRAGPAGGHPRRLPGRASTRRVDELIAQRGIQGISKSRWRGPWCARSSPSTTPPRPSSGTRGWSTSRPSASAAAEHLADAGPELLAFTGVPREHWRQIGPTDPQERLDQEIRRRTEAVGTFPRPGGACSGSPLRPLP